MVNRQRHPWPQGLSIPFRGAVPGDGLGKLRTTDTIIAE